MKSKTKTVIKLVLALIIILLLGFFRPAFALDTPVEPLKPTQDELRTIELTKWLDRLATCESNGKSNAVHLHDGKDGTRSVGLLQFKDSTFINYSKRYKLGYKPEDIWDGHKQKEVALHMLKENKNNQLQWYICSKVAGRLK